MRMLKKALIAYVNSMEAIWSAIAHPLSIVSKRKGTLKGYRIYGNSVQEGEPTPENPIEVQSVGELTKNLFNPDAPKQQGFLMQDGTIHSNGNYPNIYCFTLDVKPNTLYIFNARINNNVVYALYNEAMEFIQGYRNTEGSRDLTFTTTSDSAYVKICVDINRVNEGIQYFNEGDTLIKEPYHKYKVPVTVRGKNLFDLSKMFSTAVTLNGLTIEPYGYNGIRVYGTPTTESNTLFRINKVYTYFIKSGTTLKPSTKLDTLYGNITGGCSYSFQVGCYDPTVTWIVNANSGRSSAITLSRDMATFRTLNVDITPSDTETYLDFVFYPMIEVGSKTTPYEPYIEPQIHNIYLDEPLRKIVNHKDYIDFNKSAVVRNIGEIVVTSDMVKEKNNW